MIPDFDRNGNLPPGIHHATFDEVVERFGGIRSLKRQQLTGSLRKFYDFVIDFALGIYINGSYIANKLSPSDVDLVLVLPSDLQYDPSKLVRLIRIQNHKDMYSLHLFTFFQAQHNKELQHRIRFFREDRNGNPKGIIYVEVRQ